MHRGTIEVSSTGRFASHEIAFRNRASGRDGIPVQAAVVVKKKKKKKEKENAAPRGLYGL